MSLLIKNGRIITASDDYVADIFCQDQSITAIGTNLDSRGIDQVIDASGKYVFPGFIDPHVHIYLPFMGTLQRTITNRPAKRLWRWDDNATRNVLSRAA